MSTLTVTRDNGVISVVTTAGVYEQTEALVADVLITCVMRGINGHHVAHYLRVMHGIDFTVPSPDASEQEKVDATEALITILTNVGVPHEFEDFLRENYT